jgi:hypothetical protein
VSTVPPQVAAVLADYDALVTPDRSAEKAAVKAALAALVEIAPGRSVEIRIPPHAAVQAIEGTSHRRGNPSAVVETNARTWLELAVGRLSWAAALESGAVHASGERSDLGHLLPIWSSTEIVVKYTNQ